MLVCTLERVAQVPVDGKEGPADVCVIELGGTIGKITFSGQILSNTRAEFVFSNILVIILFNFENYG